MQRNFLRQRRDKILLLSLLLGGLCLYSALENPEISLSECLADPERYEGVLLQHFHEATVQALVPGGFIMRVGDHRIRVVAPKASVAVGDFVTLRAIFHKENYLEALQVYAAKGRRWKIALSVLPVLVVAGLFGRYFRFDRRRKILIPRNSAFIRGQRCLI